MSKRLNINPINLLSNMNLPNNVRSLMHEDGVSIIRELSKYQQTIDQIPSDLLGYTEEWK
jgi:hypothetical protein